MSRPLYLYGVAPPAALRGGAASPLGAGISLIEVDALAAVVEPFALGDLPAEVLEERLQSLDAVAPLAQRHQEVLAALSRRCPVVPARLCSLFSSVAAVQAFLREQQGVLLQLLELVRGRGEWGLKIFCDTARLGVALAAADPVSQRLLAAEQGAGPGQAYVLRRQAAARAEALGAARTDEVIDEIVAELWPHMHRQREKDLLGPKASGRGEAMVLHLAALVDDARADDWIAVVDGLAARLGPEGFVFERSGPWPPYSFCQLAEGAEDQEQDLDTPAARDPGGYEGAEAAP